MTIFTYKGMRYYSEYNDRSSVEGSALEEWGITAPEKIKVIKTGLTLGEATDWAMGRDTIVEV